MTKEDKELLLKDLCARLPYGVIVNVNGNNEKVDEINPFEGIITCGFQSFDVNECKPYLRPMSSMTEEEKKEFIHYAEYEVEESVNGRHYDYYLKDFCGTEDAPCANADAIDWLNAHHFDYRDLIEKGLAIEAPEGMYN